MEQERAFLHIVFLMNWHMGKSLSGWRYVTSAITRVVLTQTIYSLDNIDDRERKGRNIVFIGEEQPRAKLTKKAVKDARWERAYKGTSFQKLADRYGVSKKTMQNAIKGVTWKCVPYMPEPPKEE